MIRVLGDRVLVALPPREDETVSAGGIVLVKDPDRFYTPTCGIVMQLGEKVGTVDLDAARSEVHDCLQHSNSEDPDQARADVDRALMAMAPAPFDVQVGDCVLFPQSAGDQIHEDGVDYVVLHESDIIGIVEPLKDEAAA